MLRQGAMFRAEPGTYVVRRQIPPSCIELVTGMEGFTFWHPKTGFTEEQHQQGEEPDEIPF